MWLVLYSGEFAFLSQWNKPPKFQCPKCEFVPVVCFPKAIPGCPANRIHEWIAWLQLWCNLVIWCLRVTELLILNMTDAYNPFPPCDTLMQLYASTLPIHNLYLKESEIRSLLIFLYLVCLCGGLRRCCSLDEVTETQITTIGQLNVLTTPYLNLAAKLLKFPICI